MDKSLIIKVKDWLGPKGISFFRTVKLVKGSIDTAVLRTKGPIPAHPIHFREGMQVRNFLRSCPETANWTDHDYDDRWGAIVEEVIRRENG